MNPYLVRCIKAYLGTGPLQVLLLLSALTRGQAPLSLSQAVNTGLSNNFGIRIARNLSTIAGNNVTAGNAGQLPTVSLYASWDKSMVDAKLNTITGGELEEDNAPANVISGGVQVQWTLFDGTAMYVESRKLRTLAEMSKLNQRLAMENGIYDVTSAYCDIIRQQQLLEACHKSLEISNIRIKLARIRLESGSGSEQELLQSEVIRQADTTALTRQMAQVKKARVRLNQVMAEELEKEYLMDDSIILQELPPLDKLISSALLSNGIYNLQEGRTQLSAQEIRSLQAKQYPKVLLRGSYGYFENETEASFIKYNSTLGGQAGLALTMNLYDGRNLSNRIRNARIARENETIGLKDTEQRITAAVIDTWYEHQSLLQQVILGKQGVKMAGKNLGIASEAYKSGLISSVQLREAQDDLFRASSQLYDALYLAKITETDLLRLSGNLVK